MGARTTVWRTLSGGAVSVAFLLAARAASAQFVTLLPRPMSDDSAKMVRHLAVHFDSLRDSISLWENGKCRVKFAVDPKARKQCESRIDATQAALHIVAGKLRADRGIQCESTIAATLPDAAALRQECVDAIDFTKAALREAGIRFLDTSLLLPLSQRRLGGLYGSGLRVFSAFTANISEKQILILTDVISGAVGVFPFGITHATVVSSADSQGNLSADTVRRATENVLQLMNNGGTLSARFQYPVFAYGGANTKHSASVYVQTGLVGPLGQPKQVQGSGAAVAEYLLGLAVRKPDTSAALVGELVFAGRLGYARTLGGEILPGADSDKGFGFYQLGVGLQQSGALRLSVLLNHVTSRASNAFVPVVILNLSALR
jgi:hypothetical protein